MPAAKRIAFKIDELDCAEEMLLLRRELTGAPGVLELDFNVVQGRMDVLLDADQTGPHEVLRSITRLGMHGQLWQRRAIQQTLSPEQLRRIRLLTASGILLLLGLGTQIAMNGSLAITHIAPSLGDELPSDVSQPSWFHGPSYFEMNPFDYLSIGFYVLAIVMALIPVAPRARAAIRRWRADMNVLVCVAVAGALMLGEWLEGAIVSFLFGLALTLEHWSLMRARRAISTLLDLAPESASCRQSDGQWASLPLESVPVGSLVRVQPGDRIPLDGTVVSGSSHVDQASITGEPLPVFKQTEDELYAGTLNQDSPLEFRTSRTHEHSTLSRILQLVEEAHARKASGEQWIERFAGIYTPVMIGLAFAIALVPPLLGLATFVDAFYRALVLLLIACPCALVISTPVTFISALTTAARHGVLIKGGRFLEAAASCRAVVFDKTGTLTTGLPSITHVLPSPGISRAELLHHSARLETHVRHPLARAVMQIAEDEGVTIDRSLPESSFRMLAGRGIEAQMDDQRYWLGGERLLQERLGGTSLEVLSELHHELPHLLDSGHSLIAVGRASQLLGVLMASDTVRPNARNVIRQLRELGVEAIWMLTGDQSSAAQRVAQATDIHDFRAGLLPEEKVEQLHRLVARYDSVAMIGDGVNDSPALAAATVGVAMGAIGSDAALEAADVALMSDDLERFPWLIEHGRATLRVLRTNVALALGIKLLFVLLAGAGFATLWSAIAADMGTSLLVIFLALRLRSSRSPTAPPIPEASNLSPK